MEKPKSKNYFTKETEQYINKYNTSGDEKYRAAIFTEHIYYPFYKLAENIVHNFKFYYTDLERVEDLKFDIVRMLVEEKISKFDATNGAKAYSYFGTIVKRWLIAYNKKSFKKLKQITSVDSIAESHEVEPVDDIDVTISLSKFIDFYVDTTYEHLPALFPKEQERKIADAVLTIFRVRKNLGIFKKKALYIYIREITECETALITKVIGKLKIIFYDKYEKYEESILISRD